METKEKESGLSESAIAIYHEKGFVPAFKQAAKYAGRVGRIGTMLDWVDARLATPPYEKLGMHDTSKPTPWDQYYTTMSAEYVGISKSGTKILIVAHGIGPMATLDGVVEAYRYHYDDKTRRTEGGRISADEFWKLESGAYGDVEIVDLEEYVRTREHPFISTLHYVDALVDPVLKARLGSRSDEYIKQHAHYARKYHLDNHQRKIFDPYILQVNGPGMYWVENVKPTDGLAYAHLLSVGAIGSVHVSQSEHRVPSWVSDINTHDWYDGTRLIGIREGKLVSIDKGPDPRHILRKHWQELFESSGLDRAPDGIFVIMQMPDETWFTQVTKKGARADTHEPEFRVTSMEKVGEVARFYTESNYPVPIFRYDIREAQAVLPKEANAYELVGEPTKTGGADSQETCLVQGYRIEIDHTQRLIRQEVLANDYEKMMKLHEK
ncbi:MAG TPA: hypothetical protein DDY52_02260 [Candidatus Moranbacteria bacterium]|nr:MAG: hypothetical protein UR51_C0008G0047 [Candidatus Moranbacteria bacterium GW2011_GWF1_34_10]HBI16958.1 hypothetical protein [Candidatus Moranbacteria bacterium]